MRQLKQTISTVCRALFYSKTKVATNAIVAIKEKLISSLFTQEVNKLSVKNHFLIRQKR